MIRNLGGEEGVLFFAPQMATSGAMAERFEK